MTVIKKFKLLSQFALVASSLQYFVAYANQVSNDIELSPIITVKENKEENKEKEPPAPGLSFGAPSAYGAGG